MSALTDLLPQIKRHSKAIIIAALLSLFLAIFLMPGKPYGATGASVSKVMVFEIFRNKNCTASLPEGWNLASMPCNPNNYSIRSALSSIEGSYVSVHWYDPNDQIDRWKSYNPSLPSWVVQDLSNFSIQRGYWININTTASWSLAGNITLPNYILLYSGWNLAGYSSNETKNVTLAVKGINESLRSIHMYNVSDTADPWKVYNPSFPELSDLPMMLPYFGYWMNITTNASVNWTII